MSIAVVIAETMDSFTDHTIHGESAVGENLRAETAQADEAINIEQSETLPPRIPVVNEAISFRQNNQWNNPWISEIQFGKISAAESHFDEFLLGYIEYDFTSAESRTSMIYTIVGIPSDVNATRIVDSEGHVNRVDSVAGGYQMAALLATHELSGKYRVSIFGNLADRQLEPLLQEDLIVLSTITVGTQLRFGSETIIDYRENTNLLPNNVIEASTFKELHVSTNGEVLAERLDYVVPHQKYQTEAKDFEGYELKTAPAEPSGTIRQAATEIVYVYKEKQLDAFTAEVVSQTINLGGSLTSRQVQQAITNVHFNDTLLSEEDYQLMVITEPDTTVVGRPVEAIVEVTHKETGTAIELAVPISVQWGDTIIFRGYDNRTGGAYTFHPEEKVVTAAVGETPPGGQIHLSFADTYYSIEHLRNDAQYQHIGDLRSLYNYNVIGQKTPASAVAEFGNQYSQLAVQYGDILRLYHRESDGRLRKVTDEVEGRLSANQNTAYVELTNTGYHLLGFDRAKAIPARVSAGTIKKILDQNVMAYLDMSEAMGAEIVGFTHYPDTSKVGATTGTILVQEKLSTGKYVQLEYEVPFTVEIGHLMLTEIANAEFYFGEVQQSSRSQRVAAKGHTAPIITISDYSDATNWALYVSASPFISQDEQTLKGASLTLNNLHIIETVHSELQLSSKEIELTQSPQMIANMSNPENGYGEENGQSVIQIGEVKEGRLSGVDLRLPANTSMDTGTYQATLTWELIGDPTLGGSQ